MRVQHLSLERSMAVDLRNVGMIEVTILLEFDFSLGDQLMASSHLNPLWYLVETQIRLSFSIINLVDLPCSSTCRKSFASSRRTSWRNSFETDKFKFL